MLKPLLRTIPSLSGNVKLACTLSNFMKTSDIYECCCRYARLLPISSKLMQKQYEVNLLNSAYEFDLKRFYNGYSNIFYGSAFSYDKTIYEDAKLDTEINNRDKDFEFGLKRISYIKNGGAQFAFFAPIWIEGVADLPDYFLMNVHIDAKKYDTVKTIKVNLNDVDKNERYNYLSVYLNKYANLIDNNVIFCTPVSNQATYYGIDLVKGGFVKKIDNIIAKNYHFQATINKFDQNIVDGFARNKICVRQVMPLSFYFSLEDILDTKEQQVYAGAKIYVEGAYYKDNKKVKMYDFSIDYTEYTQDSWIYKNGVFDCMPTNVNIMDMDFPSLKEASYYGYDHFNKIKKDTFRWKLLQSSDEYPYVTNMSPAFSIAQRSSFKYREFPSTMRSISILCDADNDIVTPTGNRGRKAGNNFYASDPRLLVRYGEILQNSVSTWFNILDETEYYEQMNILSPADLVDHESLYFKCDDKDYIREKINKTTTSEIAELNNSTFSDIVIDNDPEPIFVKCSENEIEDITTYLDTDEPNTYTLWRRHSIFDDNSNWSPVYNNKVYFKGILYDLSSIWKKHPETQHIDKFGVFVHPDFIKIDQDRLSSISSAKWTLLTNKKRIKELNAVICPDLRGVLTHTDQDMILPQMYINEMNIGLKSAEVSHDKLFFFNTSEDKDGEFIDLNAFGYDPYEVNKYYSIKEVERLFPNVTPLIEQKHDRYVIEGYRFLPIYRLSQVMLDKNSLWFEKHKMGKTRWLINEIHFNSRENHTKQQYDSRTIKKAIDKSAKYMLEIPLMLRQEFISAYNFSYIFKEDQQLISDVDKCSYHYMFNPIMVDQNEVYAINVMTQKNVFDLNYGDDGTHKEDIDYMYVDPFNMKRVFESKGMTFNDEWLLDEKYYKTFYAKFLNKFHLKLYAIELYKDYDRLRDLIQRIECLYIKRRVMFNDYGNEEVYLKDIYIPVTKLYEDDYIDNFKIREILAQVRTKNLEGYSIDKPYDSSIEVGMYDDSYTIEANGTSTDDVIDLSGDNTLVSGNDGIYQVNIDDATAKKNEYFEFSDEFIELANITVDGNEFSGDEPFLHAVPHNVIEFYQILMGNILRDFIYDKEDGTWHMSKNWLSKHDAYSIFKYDIAEDDDVNPEEFKFELVFKSKFLKMSQELWDCMNIHDKEDFKDLYIYRISKEDDYPEALNYQCVNFNGKEKKNFLDGFVDTWHMLEPLFDDVIMQNLEKSTIYSEYNQSKISKAYDGEDVFYRYDSDNVPVIYDISTIDTANTPIYSYDGEPHYSYAYINRMNSMYHEEGDTEFSDALLYCVGHKLPTYHIIDNREATIELASGTEQVLQYYSRLTYSYIGKVEETTTTYYSESSYGRINFDYLNSLTYNYGQTTTVTENVSEDVSITTYNVHTQLVHDDVLTYRDIRARYIPNEIRYDDLGLFNEFGISTYVTTYSYNSYYSYTTPLITRHFNSDGVTSYNTVEYIRNTGYIPHTGYCTYGMLLMNAKFDNTNSSVNLIDIHHNDKKYFTKVNGQTIYDDGFNIKYDFRTIIPFIKLDMFMSLCKETPYVMKPFRLNYNAYNYPIKMKDSKWYDIVQTRKPVCSVMLERYFDSITPLLTESTLVRNSYMLKVEDRPVHMRVNKDKGESVLYKETLSIYNTESPRVYDSKENYTKVTQAESKHFNDSMAVNLETEIKIFIGDKLSMKEVVAAEEHENVLKVFKEHMLRQGTFDDEEILFLLNKYKIYYDSYPVGIDYNRICKIYSLTIIFKLL